MVGRPRNTVILTEDERAALLMWTRSRTCSQARALRAQIVLACEDEPTNTAVARRLGISRDMVGKWRSRFLAERLDGLEEQPRPGRPPTADDDTVAHVLVRTLTPPPPGARQVWSTRSMAAETGLSQSTVSRIWRTYRVQPGARATVGPRRAWSLPGHTEEVVGLFMAPPVCVLAVTARAGRGEAVRTPAGRLFGHDRELPQVLAVACAFAALRGRQHRADAAWTDHPALGAFLEQVRSAAGAGATTVHLLAHGVPAKACSALGRPEAAVPPRLRWHRAPGPAAWTDEAQRLLAADAQLPHEAAHDLPRLRDALLTWSTTWTPSAAPFTRVAAPRPTYDIPAICGPDNDSNAHGARTLGDLAKVTATQITSPDAPPGAPITTDPVVGLLRDAVLAGPCRPGDRVREAPLAARLGLSRRVVRAGLRSLAEEGMLDLLPGGATAVPAVTVKDVLDLYALRASLGALLIRRVAMLGREHLAPASAALAEVLHAARDNDHVRMREVDLRYQDALARTADLPQAALTFERLTARLRMFVTVLDMDYGPACDTIADEDTAVHDALRDADGNEAARLWRVKIERCVRYMIARLPEDDVAPHLWTTLAGRPRLRPEDARSTVH
ncbi:helix-turn-helix domain-containing protein [Streptomyces sp. TRM68367]|uniref:helix-turn-helix domain-containing protein n=1 Tax=Streptomyces sp. TRM68367 TaxID=2758415 RepID=UPI00165B9963|nr:helix-turn-helix domain-containing protein [Streptomyces sp. TRM68367]MBC9727278.1 helix-turn-helix domain-containing protein [Streptomyces sp. TRM68367]